MNQNIYEMASTVIRLQCGSDNFEENIAYLKEFLAHSLEGDFNLERFNQVTEKLYHPTFSPDSAYLKIQRMMDYLDNVELRFFFEFIESFLERFSRKSYYVYLILLYCTRLLKKSTSIYITEGKSPNLFSLLNDLDAYDALLEHLNIIRSQVSDSLRSEPDYVPVQLSEILTQLTILHCSYSYIEDEGLSVYNFLIRFARKALPNLSFQRVMRLCRSVSDLTSSKNIGLHYFYIEQVEDKLNLANKESLVAELFKIKNLQEQQVEDLDYFIDCVVSASRFSKNELGRIIFRSNSVGDQLPEGFYVEDLNDSTPLCLSITNKGELEKQNNPNGKFQFKFEVQEKAIKLNINRGQEHQEIIYEELSEQYIGGYCFILKPELGQLCYFKLDSTGLYVSNVDLEYRGNHILNNISMMANRGEMIAVVGPSGCGKSTMLTMLSGILEYSKGDIYFDGDRVSTVQDFANISTYIPQDDILFRELTVHESIDNSVKLKVKAEDAEYRERLKSTIEVLGLERTEFLKIGNEGEKGISGGQRKRVNIGTTIVAEMKPILLFDEPTSGLDPATDLEIMQLLRELSRKGHIVICVTHNLSDESIRYFDQLLVLGKSGQMQFLGKRHRALYFFSIHSTQFLFQKMKDAVNVDYHKKFMNSPECKSLMERIDYEKGLNTKKIRVLQEELNETISIPGRASNFKNFFKREMIRKGRDPQFLSMCFMQPILIGLFICWNFVGPLPNAIFSLMTATLWIGAIAGVREINSEMPQLKRDFMYGTSLMAYISSKVLSCLTFSSFQVLVLSNLVVYFGYYLSDPFSFSYLQFMFVLLLLNLFGVCLGLCLSATIKSTLAAVGILPVVLIPLIIMGGALIRHHQTAGAQWWTMKLNPLRIAYESSFYTAKSVLRPQFANDEKRSLEDAKQQKEIWSDYQEKLALFRTDIEKYKEKYTEPDVNDIFSSMLSDEQTNESVKAPVQPTKVVEPGLLNNHLDLWLDGFSILPVDHATEESSMNLFSATSYEKYKIEAPRAFSQKLSAQGAAGMYLKLEDKDMSIYRPIEYIVITLFEALSLFLAMFFILKRKLSSKF